MLDEARKTPPEPTPEPHAVPLRVSKPVLVVTLAAFTRMPLRLFIPVTAVPVIVTLPVPVAEILADEFRCTPWENCPVPVLHEVPLILSVPDVVVTVAPDTRTPLVLFVNPLPLTPVIVTQPDPPACTLDDVKFTPALTVFRPPRPSIVMLPPVVFTFTAEPLMQTPSKAPD